jgi:predicted small secreted protein
MTRIRTSLRRSQSEAISPFYRRWMEPFRNRSVGLAISDEEMVMFQKVTTAVLICTALVLAACNTVRGAARDVNSVANCTDNTMHGQNCH